MRKIISLLVVSFAFITFVNANEYLFSGDNIKSGGFGEFGIQDMKVRNKNTILNGVGGAWVINDNYFLGLSSYSNDYQENANFSYVGLYLGWMMPTSGFYSPIISTTIGYGNTMNSSSYSDNIISDEKLNIFKLFALNAGIQIKITKWFRLVPFAGWTVVEFSNNKKYKNSDFGGFNYGISFNFGKWKK